MFGKKKKTAIPPIDSKEVQDAFADAGLEVFKLLMICYDKKTKEFDLSRVEKQIDDADKEFSKRHVAFKPLFMSALVVPNIKETVEKALEKELIPRRMTPEEEAEFNEEQAKNEKEENKED